MIILADCGATKSRWIVTDNRGTTTISAPAVNAATMSSEALSAAISEAHKQICNIYGPVLPLPDIHVDVYAAGARGKTADILRSIVSDIFGKEASVTAGSDMELSARASLGKQSGIACILGTGSNTCLWNGQKITEQIPSLGYILGDEGSGASIGRRFIADYLKGFFQDDLTRQIAEQFPELKTDSAIEYVYKRPGGNTWLASFVPFIKDNLYHTPLYNLVADELRRFFERNVNRYNTESGTRIGLTGGIAETFRNIVEDLAKEYGYEILSIHPDPLELLATSCSET